ncbi:MAG: WXG100 family type VII secretion target [Chloroflexi bacterium]|nr:WXG100 family type VII secretion target [Chloroflexota bacterium]
MSIFTCVMDDVTDVVNQVTRQAGQVEDMVGSVRGGMQPIIGGGWTGQGAQAFIEEVQSRLIPEIMALIASISGFGGGITQAMDFIREADDGVLGVVNNVGDIFDGIF